MQCNASVSLWGFSMSPPPDQQGLQNRASLNEQDLLVPPRRSTLHHRRMSARGCPSSLDTSLESVTYVRFKGQSIFPSWVVHFMTICFRKLN